MKQGMTQGKKNTPLPGGTADAGKKPGKLRQWWENYIRRLNKATGGKPQCCK